MATAANELKIALLEPSKLQRGLLDDLDLDHLKFVIKRKIGIDIADRITQAVVERTIEGASTLTVTLDDSERDVLQSGTLTAKPDIELDGLWFRLAGVNKTGDALQLTFEDREIAVLRTYAKKKGPISRTVMTRAEFILSLIQEVKEIKIPWVIPELHKIQPIEASNQTSPDWSSFLNRDKGLDAVGLTIKGAKPNQEQIANINTVLDVGKSMVLPRKNLVIAIMTAIQESSILNLDYPLPGAGNFLSNNKLENPVGVFQQRYLIGGKRSSWPASRDVAKDAKGFFDALVNVIKFNPPGLPYQDYAEKVQRSGNGAAYGQWRTEAENIVTAYGLLPSTASSANAMAGQIGQAGSFHYYRGKPTTVAGKTVWEPENSWQAIQRLADEVGWRAFFVQGTFYYLSEDYLFQSKPQFALDETTEGIHTIDFEYQTNTKAAEVNVEAEIKRWAGVPGTVVSLRNMGPCNGRWLVNTIERPLYDTNGTITLKKPRPVLPEPAQDTIEGQGQSWATQPDPSTLPQPVAPADRIAAFALHNADGSGNFEWGPDIIIGTPGQGTHAPLSDEDWESTKAIDWRGPAGTPVVAVEDGSITKVNMTKVDVHSGTHFGVQLHLVGDSGIEWFYTHITNVDAAIVPFGTTGIVYPNVRVVAGQLIAEVTYWADAPKSSHLHLGCTEVSIVQSLTLARQIDRPITVTQAQRNTITSDDAKKAKSKRDLPILDRA